MNRSLRLRLVNARYEFRATPIRNPKSEFLERMLNPPTLGTETLKEFLGLEWKKLSSFRVLGFTKGWGRIRRKRVLSPFESFCSLLSNQSCHLLLTHESST